MAYFFKKPFGVDGDRTDIDMNTQPSGEVSYQQGFTSDYELDLLTDPDAKPVPRRKSNQLYFQITQALQQYQTHGEPDWITSADNGGTPFDYDIYARVRYSATPGTPGSFLVYENQVQGNTATPGTDETWLLVSANAAGVPTGTVIDFASPIAPSGYLACDGTTVSRSTYVLLKNAITFAQTGTTTTSSTALTGLSSTANMFAGMALEGTGIPAGTTIASITNGTSLVMSASATASASVSVRFYPWGAGNGTTTFTLPDLRRNTTIGAGGTGTATIGSVVGQRGGEEAHTMTGGELAAHTHPAANGNFVENVGSGGTNATFTAVGTTSKYEANTGSSGSGTPFNVMQPSTVMFKCIKT